MTTYEYCLINLIGLRYAYPHPCPRAKGMTSHGAERLNTTASISKTHMPCNLHASFATTRGQHARGRGTVVVVVRVEQPTAAAVTRRNGQGQCTRRRCTTCTGVHLFAGVRKVRARKLRCACCARHVAGEWWLEGGEERDVAVEIGCAGQGQGRRADSEQRGPPRHKRRDARPSDGGSITKRSGFIAPAAAELESKAYELAPARAAELGNVRSLALRALVARLHRSRSRQLSRGPPLARRTTDRRQGDHRGGRAAENGLW